jgi:hypothetical protein
MAKCISQSTKIVIGVLLLLVLVYGATHTLREGATATGSSGSGSGSTTTGSAQASALAAGTKSFGTAAGADSTFGSASGGGGGGSGGGGGGSGSFLSGGLTGGTPSHPCSQSCSAHQQCVTDHRMKNTCCVSTVITETPAWLANPGCPDASGNPLSTAGLAPGVGNAVNAPFLSYSPGKRQAIALAPVNLGELEAG